MANTYGNNLKLSIFGGSHDPEIGMTLTGFPAGVRLSHAELMALMSRRAPGKNSWSTTRKEADEPVFTNGVTAETSLTTDGGNDTVYTTDGSPIRAVIINHNQRSGDYHSFRDTPRPSHADYPARMKFGESVDLRGGGKYSGRLTAPLCIAGALCMAFLKSFGVTIGAHILSVGSASDVRFDPVGVTAETLTAPGKAPFPVLDATAGEQMRGEIECARLAADSVGGVVECGVVGLTAGQLGDHPFDGVEGRLAAILYSIPAVRGVAFGGGFDLARGYGSTTNDAYIPAGDGRIRTRTNHNGGVLGGMTTGMPLLFTVAFKPTPSIGQAQDSVSLATGEAVRMTVVGRHDPCIVPRAVPVVEAAAAVGLTDLWLDQV